MTDFFAYTSSHWMLGGIVIMLIFSETKEMSMFISSYFTVYSKDSSIVKIIDSDNNKIVGEAVLNMQKISSGVYIEFIGIYLHERSKGYGRLAVQQLKEEYQTLYGWATNDARGFWGEMGVIYTDQIRKSFIIL